MPRLAAANLVFRQSHFHRQYFVHANIVAVWILNLPELINVWNGSLYLKFDLTNVYDLITSYILCEHHVQCNNIHHIQEKSKPKCCGQSLHIGPTLFIASALDSMLSSPKVKVAVMSSTKLNRFWQKLVHSVLNKCATKYCKRFPLYMNNVSTLPCET